MRSVYHGFPKTDQIADPSLSVDPRKTLINNLFCSDKEKGLVSGPVGCSLCSQREWEISKERKTGVSIVEMKAQEMSFSFFAFYYKKLMEANVLEHFGHSERHFAIT